MKKLVFGYVLCIVMMGSLCAQGLDDAFRYASSGLIAQKVRLSLVAQNLANVSTLEVAGTGLPYQKKYAVLEPSSEGVRISSIENSNEPFARYFDSAVPQSDEYGFTNIPNVNIPEEMVVMVYSETMYEANLSVLKTTKSLYQSTIDALK